MIFALLFWVGTIGLGLHTAMMSLEAFLKDHKGFAIFFGIIAVVFFALSGMTAFKLGKDAALTLSSSHHYLKGQSSFGTPLSVHDMSNGKDRIIVTNKYPPTGFIEVVATDGRIMLLPEKVVSGQR